MHNPLEPRLEHQLHAARNIDELHQAAKLLNQLYHLERIKTDWAIREAANNLAAICGYDRDSC
jgi:hypothetical protein